MKQMTLILMMTMLTFSAQAGRWAVAESTAVRALETTAGQRLLSTLTGRSQSEIVAMSVEARQTALTDYMSGLPEGAELSNQVTRSLTALADGDAQASTLVAAIIENPANAQYFRQVSARSILRPTAESTPTVTTNEFAHTDEALALLRNRVQQGEIPSAEVTQFAQTVGTANRALGIDVFAEGVTSCMRTYPSRLVGNLMKVISGLKQPKALANTRSAFAALTSRSREVFKDTAAKAEERVCGLAGVGYRCRILNPSLCAL